MVNSSPKKSIDFDVKWTEPVNKVFWTPILIKVGGIGFEPESNWKYNEDGTNLNSFLIFCKLPPSKVLVSSTNTGI